MYDEALFLRHRARAHRIAQQMAGRLGLGARKFFTGQLEAAADRGLVEALRIYRPGPGTKLLWCRVRWHIQSEIRMEYRAYRQTMTGQDTDRATAARSIHECLDLREALAKLALSDKHIAWLRLYSLGYNAREIAEMCGVSGSWVASTLRMVRKALKGMLNR